jgi:hypothetical protein
MPYRRRIVSVSEFGFLFLFLVPAHVLTPACPRLSWQPNTRREMREAELGGDHSCAEDVHRGVNEVRVLRMCDGAALRRPAQDLEYV